MELMLTALRILHVILAAAWFGHKILIPRDIRYSVASDDLFAALRGRMATAQRLGIAAGLGTLLSGVGLILLTTGFADAPMNIYAGFAIAITMFLVGAFMARPAWKRLAAAENRADRVGAVKGFTRTLALENLLWVLALAAMLS